jgi:hypothetical protein
VFAVGVPQPDSHTVLRLLSLFPAALFPFCAGVPAIGVGQPFIRVLGDRGVDARIAGISLPAGVSLIFAVWRYRVDGLI